MELSRQMLALLVDSLDCGIFTVDTEQRITSWNRAAEKITGFRSSEMIGRKCSDIKCLNCIKCGDYSCSLFRDGEIKKVECVIERPDGRPVRVLKSGRLIYSAEGKLLGGVESFSAIAALKSDLSVGIGSEAGDDETLPVPGMIGSSQAMRQVYRLVRFASLSESTVLITGESGTGKELVAHAVHTLSSRSEGPFVAVNCSALPESLLESELFGHVKGAFSGAVSNKVGRFEITRGGTIFLDEIGDISPLIQLKLLRVLQNQEYQRVGESITRKADVRVITATNKDLFQEVRKGTFREDLFFRLKVFPIHLPPLRERKEDVPGLVEHFIRIFNRKTGKKISRVHQEAMKLLYEYCYPGNVRELEHAIEYAFVLCQGEEIGPFELPQEILRVEYRKQFCPPNQLTGQPGLSPAVAPILPGRGRWARPGREELLQVLNRTGWNQTQAARVLGVSRVTVWSWMKKMGLKRPGIP
ncbi:MAG TPA: sigma 54-interacting transcriptional regulator [archaeon]|nr:sigma 54-interacting transcriptional regulator [archaeon]